MFSLLRVSQRLSLLSTPHTSRSLASSVLLSRSWHNESIGQLRTEAKSRGLSAKGSKSALAARIEEYENSLVGQHSGTGTRQASTNSPSVETDAGGTVVSSVASPSPAQPESLPEIPGIPDAPSPAPLPTQTSVESEAQEKEMLPLADGESDGKIVHTVGSPSPIQPEDLPEVPGNPDVPTPINAYTMDVKLPELNQPIPVAPVQVPYVPDFWDSWKASVNNSSAEERLRLLVVGGAGTHYGGGPSHNAVDSHGSSESTPDSAKTDSFVDDIAEDLGLPPVANALCKNFSKLFSFRGFN
ncbi:hypothetical protein D9619_005627 [Psilocybe cf. subviscida]|uniref:SAP domain-containing protein n=1 Tax=Psilocybe cf. subviscida TaxID=2480587 RepID=A0A8H5BVY6_9AGAR|nr:hypothetical protein D9619_005627 [Psilocybe cf. subviscida]